MGWQTREMRRRFLLVALVALVAVLLVPLVLAVDVPAAGAGSSAIHPDNRPTRVEGDENGRLPPERLINVAPGCEAYRDAAPSLGRLLATARHEGVAVGTRECYRAIDDQVAVRQSWTARGNSACAAPVQRDERGRPVGTSNHGWGKAADFSDSGGSMRFTSPGYGFLEEQAGRFGWNHPGWAEPGGSACPEAWHWEWVGDGGTMGGDPIRADVVGLAATPSGAGYSGIAGLGGVAHRGDAVDGGDASGLPLNWLVVGGARRPDGDGYWLVASDGGVFGYGDARFHGSTGGMRLNEPVVAMAASPDGEGYWLVASDGGVFSFGSARFRGSLGDTALQRPIVGMAATASGRGYWLVAADGGVFAFGDARFHGSLGDRRDGGDRERGGAVVAMAATPDGGGYWLASAEGAVYPFGAAADHGSMAGHALNLPLVGMATRSDGDGYWLVAADGGVFAFGGARFHGGV